MENKTINGVYIVYHTTDVGIFWIFKNENDARALLKELNQNSNEYDITYECILQKGEVKNG